MFLWSDRCAPVVNHRRNPIKHTTRGGGGGVADLLIRSADEQKNLGLTRCLQLASLLETSFIMPPKCYLLA